MNSYVFLVLFAVSLIVPCVLGACDPACNENECCAGLSFLSQQCKPLGQEGATCSMTRVIGQGLMQNCPCAKGFQCLVMRCVAEPTTPSSENATTPATTTTTPAAPETTLPPTEVPETTVPPTGSGN